MVNRQRVLHRMRRSTLLCLRKQGFVRSTNAQRGLAVSPNLIPELTLRVPYHLWVADMTYVRLQREFIYVAVILNAYGRRCLGCALDYSLDAQLALVALRVALAARAVPPGLVQYSHRGVRYPSHAYAGQLKEYGIWVGMSRTGNPYKNVQAGSFIKILKYEEVYLFRVPDIGRSAWAYRPVH